jgi:hypothetical protein
MYIGGRRGGGSSTLYPQPPETIGGERLLQPHVKYVHGEDSTGGSSKLLSRVLRSVKLFFGVLLELLDLHYCLSLEVLW